MTINESPTLSTGTWTIDPTHTEIGFVVRHMGLSKVRGRFNAFVGAADIADDLTTSAVHASIDMASVDTNNELRDNHLKSTDFFGADNHPQMVFRSTAINGNGSEGIISGDLTVNGVTKGVDLETEFFGVGVDPYGNVKAGFAATTQISRKDFGIDFNVPLDAGGVLIGDKVTIELDVQLARS